MVRVMRSSAAGHHPGKDPFHSELLKDEVATRLSQGVTDTDGAWTPRIGCLRLIRELSLQRRLRLNQPVLCLR
ncbi:hypothetical protein VZT92_014035 [Zoarces viviparus]|uniref:Uncharacterized protein n=1 Tax=Zoarces viviparus TaxID=48416 RepID=A0AAW1EZZ4_ZOAVI